jgi:ABC-type sugar transport system ATPase subunit
MEEIRAIADRSTVMRDESVVATDAVEKYMDAQLNELIAGREGAAVWVISWELPELLLLSHRIGVVN